VRVGKVVNKYKVAKHFELTIEDTGFEFKRLQSQIAAEAPRRPPQNPPPVAGSKSPTWR
jgi:hypothetical protein